MKQTQLIRDISLVLIFLVAGCLLLLWNNIGAKEGSYVIVACNGEEVARYPLWGDVDYSLNGGTNHLEIKDGKVRMADANCPDKLCVKQGWVWYTGQCLTCLPNKINVTVVGGDDSVDLVM